MTTKKSNDPASGAAPQESAGILEHFDSLGDNCEFAFAQKRFGVDKSSLLRWAVTPFSALLSGLENRFEGLYQFERLTCTSDGMVREGRYGFFFHSKMRSRMEDGKREFLLDEQGRRAVWEEESQKIGYLKVKLLALLDRAGAIFIYKRNAGLTEDMMTGLRDALLRYNGHNLLMVIEVASDPYPAGDVRRAAPGLIRATLDRFAPYDRAYDVSGDLWLEICRKALVLRDKEQAEE